MINSIHRSKNSYYSKCHFCVCTVCNRKFCPWKEPCQKCYDKNMRKPNLDCDYFSHNFVRFYKVKKTNVSRLTFCIFYKGTKIASGLTYNQMKTKIKGKPDYIVKIDKIVHPYDIW